MIGVGVFKERGLMLTQKPPQDLANGEARFRKRTTEIEGKTRHYWELTIKSDDLFSVSVCDWKDFQKESAAGLGPALITKMVDEALKNIDAHKELAKQ